MEIVQPYRVGPNEERQTAKWKILQEPWVSFFKDEMDVAKSIQTKAELSYAMTVTDKIGGGSSGMHLYLLKNSEMQRSMAHGNLQGQEKGLSYKSGQLALRKRAG